MARGSLRRRGTSWQLRVYLRTDPDGHQRYLSRTVRGLKRDAERALIALQASVNTDHSVVAGDATVSDLLDYWQAVARADWSPSTAAFTRTAVDRWISPVVGTVKLETLSTRHVDGLYMSLRASGLSPATVRRIHQVLHRALELAVSWGWLTANPARSASPPKDRPSALQVPESEAVARLIGAAGATNLDHQVFLELAAHTGARRGELCALRWSDINRDRGELLIARTVLRDGPDLVEKEPKNGRARRIALDDRLVTVLRAHRARAFGRALARGVHPVADPYVFSGRLDGSCPLHPNAATQRFRRLCTRADIDGVRLHDLRHWAATEMLISGIDVRTVAGRLGHADPAMTLRRYAHFIPAADRAAAEALSRALWH